MTKENVQNVKHSLRNLIFTKILLKHMVIDHSV